MIAAALAFVLTSSTFKPNATMPLRSVYKGCGGQNVSPQLSWSAPPPRTRSLALIVHDPDAPNRGGWDHWIAYNLPPSMRGLREGARLLRDDLGTSSFGEIGYGGPCPPAGKPHHYHFTLYALDIPKISGEHLTGAQLRAAMRGHILARASLTGIYATSLR